MRLILSTGTMRVVNVGMYNSLLSSEYMFDDEEDRVKFSDALSEEEKEYFAEAIWYNWNQKAYEKVVIEYAMEALTEFFKDISDTIKVKLCEGATIDSPRYYNYRNDYLDFEVEVEQAEIDKVLPAVINDERFWDWIYKRYSSHPGFISFMPYDKKSYIEAIQGKDVDRALAMYLTYIYEKDCDFEEQEFDYTYYIWENIRDNHGIEEFIDDEKAWDISYRAYKAENDSYMVAAMQQKEGL